MATNCDTESIDRAFDIVSDPTRRCILRYLHARPQSRVTVDELCRVAREQSDRDGPPRNVDQLALTLHHVHLPKLAAVDFIDYDQSARTVQYRSGSFIEELLEAIPGDPR